ncbi:hypothetical protein ACGCE5_08480 [Kluyvera ascorbata]|uniref:hypothetical protein n=1 Tax=Kluyvera ascorbata TaxID=51288 RepID=UPI00374D29DD
MTATNQQMTSEQLADLSTLAVQLQAKAEANDDRDTAVMAYAVQKACAELIESRREFTAANATIHNLEQGKAELVAELSAIDAIHNDAVFINDEHYDKCPPEVQKIIVALAVLKIPAYDAYLAEVRAQMVEMLATAYDERAKESTHYMIINHCKVKAEQAREFAAQLRQGSEL